jgi:hypothetical protein
MNQTEFATDPVFGGPVPPIPRPNRKAWDKQIIWPRDKKQGGAHTWRRWKDILTNKGPDMWLSQRNSPGLHRPVWTGWNQEGRDNLGYHYRNDNQVRPPRWARRPEWQRYDFHQRKYRMPDRLTWTDVKWSRKGRTPLYTRGPEPGQGWVNPEYDGGAFNRSLRRNPFAWHDDTPFWDWHHDQLTYPLFE